MLGLTRRALLSAGALGAASAGVGTWSLMPGQPAYGMVVLTQSECATVTAIGQLFFPGVRLPSITEAELVVRVDRIVAEVLMPIQAGGFRYVLRALQWGTLAARGRRFTDLSTDTQREVLETWAEPEVVPRRVAGESLKAVLGMAYFGAPVVQQAIGWRTGCSGVRS